MKLGVAVVGLGIGAQHAKAYAALDTCQLRWVYDLDAAKAGNLIREIGVGAVARTFSEILDDRLVDIVSIASYDDVHFEQTVAALRTRRHAFVEKPLCRSFEELRPVRQAWLDSGGRHLASNLVLRAAPFYQWLKRAIATGELGDVYAFDGDYLYGRLEKITSGWRKNVENYSVMLGGGVHLVDLMIGLTGERPVSVTAAGNRLCTSASAFRYDDYMAATFHFRSGMVGRVTANFGCTHPHQHVVRIFGTRATFIADDQGPRLQRSRQPSDAARAISLSTLPETKGVLIPGFVAAILEGTDPRPGAQHEFDVISACLAADRARRNECEEEVEYV